MSGADSVVANVAPMPTATAQPAETQPPTTSGEDPHSWVPSVLLAVAVVSFGGAAVLGVALIFLRYS